LGDKKRVPGFGGITCALVSNFMIAMERRIILDPNGYAVRTGGEYNCLRICPVVVQLSGEILKQS
jgi:hypothetical protein